MSTQTCFSLLGVDYVRLAEKLPSTPVIDIDYIDPEFRDADHMTKVYHKMLT